MPTSVQNISLVADTPQTIIPFTPATYINHVTGAHVLTINYHKTLKAHVDSIKDDLTSLTTEVNELSINSHWYGKNVLTIGDSMSAGGVWQQKLVSGLGMVVTNHSAGGMSLIQLVDGDGGSFPALTATDVTGKDLIIIFGGYNDRASIKGLVGDVYPTQSTFAGKLQYVINTIYTLLTTAENLDCRIVLATPHCVGLYSYILVDGYGEYPDSSGQSLKDICDIMIEIANHNNLPCYNTWRNSGIGKNTWSIYAYSPVAYIEAEVQDQVHLNTSVGQPHLGECIVQYLKGIGI